MFVSKEPVPVSVPEDPDNIIYIKAKMDYGTKQRVQQAMLQVTLGQASTPSAMPLDMGAYNIALLVHNIVRWDGPAFAGAGYHELLADPAFAGVSCTPANIERLDSDEPLVEAVLAEINRRNKGRDDSDPNSSAPSETDG